jgi:signal transduction histidine kinase
VTDAARPAADDMWTAGYRWGPYALLALGTVLALLTADAFDRAGTVPLMLGLAAAATLLQHLCVDRRRGGRTDDAFGHGYAVARWALAFVLTWLNPFYAVFAVTGYFDSHLYLARRWQVWMLVATAVTMAGSQSGGFPPSGWVQAGAFLALLALNIGLALFFARISLQDAERAVERDDTIRRLEEALAENAELQARLVQQARESGVRDERERLAVEIHDTIAQGLIGILTQLQAADDAGDAADDTAARRHRVRAAQLAREALAEARRSVQGLHPRRLDDGDLGSALGELAEEWAQSTGIPAEVVVTGAGVRLHDDVGTTVLRVAQESLANVGKHASASRVGVTLSYMDTELTLDVRDDGVGFDPAAVRPRADGGTGLLGMRQRAARLAGDLVVESEPGQGTAVCLRVPSVSRG